MTTKSVSHIRIDSELKQKAQKLSKDLWLSFSDVVNLLLKKFILEKKIEISIDSNEWTTVLDFEKENINQDEFLDELKKAVNNG